MGTIESNLGLITILLALWSAIIAHQLRRVANALERTNAATAVENERLRRLNEGLAERVAAQSELLSRRSEKGGA